MHIRSARGDDAPALGRVMVESWLAAHQGQVPDVAWRERRSGWTPEVSARGWSRVLSEQSRGDPGRAVLLVAEHEDGSLVGLAYATTAPDDPSGAVAALSALYVLPGQQHLGIGSSLVRAVARELSDLAVGALRVDVLAANAPARRFYEAMGGIEVGPGVLHEDGHALPVISYEWADLRSLASGPSKWSRTDGTGSGVGASPSVRRAVATDPPGLDGDR